MTAEKVEVAQALDALRGALAKSNARHRIAHSTPDASLVEALQERDAKYSVCPFARSDYPAVPECKVCGADSSEPCRKRVIADAEFVDSIRAILSKAVGGSDA